MEKIHLSSFLKVATLVICGILIGVASSISAVGTWTAPTTAPPDGNVDAPLNTGNATQTRMGALGIGVSSVASGILLDVNGRAVINTLGVVNLVVATGSPAVGKVLTALDSQGTAAWQAVDVVPVGSDVILETQTYTYPCPPVVMEGAAAWPTTYDVSYGNINDYDQYCDGAGGGGGALMYDPNNTSPTATHIQGLHAFCQIMGYRGYMSLTTRTFDSPGNNKVIKYEPSSTAASKFRFFDASSSQKTIAKTVVCQRISSIPDYPDN